MAGRLATGEQTAPQIAGAPLTRPLRIHTAAPLCTEAELDRYAATRIRSARILRTILALLILLELAGLAGAAPSLLRGGVAALLGLPFFGPSMLGIFAYQVLLRPLRGELIASLVAAALLVVPLQAALSATDHSLVTAISCAVGFGSVLVLTASALLQKDSSGPHEPGALAPTLGKLATPLDVLTTALVVPAFVALASPMVNLTAALWPTTFDHRMYLADAAFGAPLSFTIGRWTAGVPLLPDLCLAVYVALPLALMLVHALRLRAGERSSDTLVAFVALTVVGYAGYHVAPVAGPIYAFGDLFPLSPPAPESLSAARSLVQPMPRNCMPSLHSAWALLVFWNARPLGTAARAVAAVFLGITLLATVALGFHYVVDLVAALPLAMAMQAWATSVTEPRLRRLAIAAGLAMSAAWIALLLWSGLVLPAPLWWLLAAAIAGASIVLELRVHSMRDNSEPAASAVLRPLTWHERGAAALLLLSGLQAFLYFAIASGSLGLLLGSTAATRVALLAIELSGLALGAAAGGRIAAQSLNPLGPLVLSAATVALSSWFAPQLLGWIGETVGSAGSAARLLCYALAGLLLLPAAGATGVSAGVVAEHWRARGVPRSAALACGLLGIGVAAAALATAYAVLPSVFSLRLCAVLAVAVVLLAAGLAAKLPKPADGDEASAPVVEDAPLRAGSPSLAGVAAVAAAMLAAAVVTIAASLFSIVASDTAYSRAQAAFVIALGIGLGLLAVRRLLESTSRERIAGSTSRERIAGNTSREPLLAWTLAILAVSTAAALLLWSDVPGYLGSFRGYVEEHRMMVSFAERELVRLALAVVFLLPAALSIGCALACTSASGAAGESGRESIPMLACTAVAAVAAAAIAGFLLLPAAGSSLTLKIGASLSVALAVVVARPDKGRGSDVAAVAALTALLLLLAPPLDLSRLAAGNGLAFEPRSQGLLVDAAESLGSLATIHAADDEKLRLVTGGSVVADLPSKASSPPLPSPGLAHLRGRDAALRIGLGSGEALRVLQTAGFGSVVVAESSPAVVALVSRRFFAGESIRVVDGRSMLALEDAVYDYVEIGPSEVTSPDASSHFTREMYAVVAARLAAGGVMQQQLAPGSFSAIAMASVLASARRVFDDVWLYVRDTDAVLVACKSACEPLAPPAGVAVALPSGAAVAALAGFARFDRAAIDRLLESAASDIGTSAEALGASDLDLFLAYHVPRSLVRPYGEPMGGIALLERLSAPGAGN